MPTTPKLITLKEASDLYKISETTLFRWIRHGRLTGYAKPGHGHVTFLDEDQLKRVTQPKPKG